jgi:hypothetical protein
MRAESPASAGVRQSKADAGRDECNNFTGTHSNSQKEKRSKKERETGYGGIFLEEKKGTGTGKNNRRRGEQVIVA